MKWIFSLSLFVLASAAFAEQGACFGKMKYEYLNEGVERYTTVAVWDKPRGDGNYEEWGTSHAVSFPSEISGHEFLWAEVFFGKDRGRPIFETRLDVFGNEKLTDKFTTSLEDEPFYVRVEYQIECSQIILEQRFEP